MGVRTTFGMGWWDPYAMVKICFQKITLTNILVRVGHVGQVGQGWSGWGWLTSGGASDAAGRPACLSARGCYLTICPFLLLCSYGAPYT